MKSFSYHSEEKTMMGGQKIVRNVTIKNGKGTKSVKIYKNGRKVGTAKKPICKAHLRMIKNKKFIPGLFADCVCK